MKSIALKIASLIFITTFIFIKVVNIHGYTHLIDDDTNSIEKCQFCEFYNTHEEIAIIVPSSTTIIPKPVVITEFKNDYFTNDTVFVTSYCSGKYYNKPPPLYL